MVIIGYLPLVFIVVGLLLYFLPTGRLQTVGLCFLVAGLVALALSVNSCGLHVR